MTVTVELDTPVQGTNDQLVLICGLSGVGKSASLRNIRNQNKWMFMGTESGKKLPFRNTFDTYRISDPWEVIQGFDWAMDPENTNPPEGIIVDSLTFLMEMFESRYIYQSADSRKAWGDYNQFFKALLQDRVIRFGKPVIFTAHIAETLDEKAMEIKSAVPVKGALAKQSVESYFSTIVYATKKPLKELKDFSSELLNITEDEEELGFKHVFQTRVTKTTTGTKIRGPMGLFNKSQTYMDNCAQLLLDHLSAFYNN